MRENRTYGSEGGAAIGRSDPIQSQERPDKSGPARALSVQTSLDLPESGS